MMSDFNLLEMAESFEAGKKKFLDVYGEYHRCRWCGRSIVKGLMLREYYTYSTAYYFCNEDCLTAWDEDKANEYGRKEADDANRTDG